MPASTPETPPIRVASPEDRAGAPGPHPWTNRLVRETSPYLLQHAHNPVDWYPWGEEAFRRARDEDKPILLSIGYAACHWCHVMEHESFEDADVAAFLNTHFVPVKVDREERPDVDAIYIHALLNILGHAGWPANLFLLPDLRPFTGGTYMPPYPRYGMPSFRQALERVADSWRTSRASLDRSASRITELLGGTEEPVPGALDHAGYVEVVAKLLQHHDDEHGGFGHDQKFPQTPEIELLLLATEDGLPDAEEALVLTLRAMDDGGLQDHLGGGFHRYCVDREWAVPHFEKMLYDNAQLVRVYARASALFLARGREHAAEVKADVRVVRDTVGYLLRDLQHASGAFFASEDADDPGGEGYFYTFTPAEAEAALGPLATDPLPFGIEEVGNFEHGRTVLSAWKGRPSREVRELLLEARSRRERPARDEKRVVAWNGLAIGALAEAGRLFGAEDWVSEAARCAESVLGARDADGLLPRVIGGDAPGTLDDQACVADGLLDLYQARPDQDRWLREALALVDASVAAFADPDGGFFQSRDRPDLIVRRKEYQDGAEPSGNGRMADVLRRLDAYGVHRLRPVLDGLLEAGRAFLVRYGPAAAQCWGVLRALSSPDRPPLELVIAGDADHPRTRQMLRLWQRTWRPQAVVAIVPDGSDLGRTFTLLADRSPAPDGGPRAYLCTRGACRLPVDDVEELAALLG